MSTNKELYVTRPYLPQREQFDKYLDEIWDSYQLTNHGPLHNRLQADLSKMFDGNCVTLVANGHLGLDVALHVMDVAGEVITTPFSFASTTHALTWIGLSPVFCDVKDSDLTIDPDKIEALITERTTAILPVHVYGHLCDMERIDEIARKHGLKVIYDAAHAFGVRLDGKSIAAFGDVSMFSFHATKLFHTVDGGALVYTNTDIQRKFDVGTNFGIWDYAYDYIGTNAKMNEFQAAMGLCVLPHLKTLIEERKLINKRYIDNLSAVNGIKIMSHVDTPRVEHNFAYMPILVDEESFRHTADDMLIILQKQQINCRRYFHPLISDYACYKGRFSDVPTPVARRVADQILCLPIFNGMRLQDVDRVCEAILDCKSSYEWV